MVVVIPNSDAIERSQPSREPECNACAYGIQLFADDGHGRVRIASGAGDLDAAILSHSLDGKAVSS